MHARARAAYAREPMSPAVRGASVRVAGIALLLLVPLPLTLPLPAHSGSQAESVGTTRAMPFRSKTCALEECTKVFPPQTSADKYCSAKHSALGAQRKAQARYLKARASQESGSQPPLPPPQESQPKRFFSQPQEEEEGQETCY